MSDQAVSEILKRVDALAAKLGVTSEYLWAVLVKQARIEAVTLTSIAALIVVFLVVAFRYVKRNGFDWIEDEAWGFPVAFFGVVATVFGALFICIEVLPLVPTLIFNPEYWALKQILP